MAPESFTGRYILYRFFDSQGDLLYVGQTCNLNQRIDNHRLSKPWWHEVADCRVEFLSDQCALDEAERRAVVTESPRHNKIRYLVAKTQVVARPTGGAVPEWVDSVDRFGVVRHLPVDGNMKW